eukprot:3795719-Pleurochrysis_carterae.AAC.1
MAYVLSAAARYEQTGERRARLATEAFWRQLQQSYTYATGGSSFQEEWRGTRRKGSVQVSARRSILACVQTHGKSPFMPTVSIVQHYFSFIVEWVGSEQPAISSSKSTVYGARSTRRRRFGKSGFLLNGLVNVTFTTRGTVTRPLLQGVWANHVSAAVVFTQADALTLRGRSNWAAHDHQESCVTHNAMLLAARLRSWHMAVRSASTRI